MLYLFPAPERFRGACGWGQTKGSRIRWACMRHLVPQVNSTHQFRAQIPCLLSAAASDLYAPGHPAEVLWFGEPAETTSWWQCAASALPSRRTLSQDEGQGAGVPRHPGMEFWGCTYT